MKLPLWEKPIGAFSVILKLGFKGIYWECPDLDENYSNCLITTWNPKKDVLWSDKWQIFYEFLRKLPNFKEVIDLDIGVIVVIFTLDLKAQEIFKNVKIGSYSKIPENLANRYYIGFKQGSSYQKDEYLIIKKSESYRKKLEESLDCIINPNWELCEKPKKEEEVFHYNRINRI